MSKCCSNTTMEPGCHVTVKVDVAKIVGYLCIASVLIIGIIFGTRCYSNIVKHKKDYIY